MEAIEEIKTEEKGKIIGFFYALVKLSYKYSFFIKTYRVVLGLCVILLGISSVGIALDKSAKESLLKLEQTPDVVQLIHNIDATSPLLLLTLVLGYYWIKFAYRKIKDDSLLFERKTDSLKIALLAFLAFSGKILSISILSDNIESQQIIHNLELQRMSVMAGFIGIFILLAMYYLFNMFMRRYLYVKNADFFAELIEENARHIALMNTKVDPPEWTRNAKF
jgi:hypothetical protein